MKFKNYINELSMRKETRIITDEATSDTYIVDVFLEGGDVFNVSAVVIVNNETPDDIDRKLLSSDKLVIPFKPDIKLSMWEIDFEDDEGSYYTSSKDSGVGLELFAAIEKFFKDFMKKYKPEGFTFGTISGNEKSKIKLYRTLAKRIEKGYPNYKKFETERKIDWYLIRKDLLLKKKKK